MAGETPEHAALATAVAVRLSVALDGKPCPVFGSDLRVRVEATDSSTYPDVTVVCGKLERSALDPNAAVNPVLLVEVLSDTTEAYDRGEKFAHYQRIDSLREYLLVSQRRPLFELYRKSEAGQWMLLEASGGDVLQLESLAGASLAVDDVYRNPLSV
ncbi:MAG: Uma2 family endonuclease [Deltaproteobacteria bacterium]